MSQVRVKRLLHPKRSRVHGYNVKRAARKVRFAGAVDCGAAHRALKNLALAGARQFDRLWADSLVGQTTWVV